MKPMTIEMMTTALTRTMTMATMTMTVYDNDESLSWSCHASCPDGCSFDLRQRTEGFNFSLLSCFHISILSKHLNIKNVIRGCVSGCVTFFQLIQAQCSLRIPVEANLSKIVLVLILIPWHTQKHLSDLRHFQHFHWKDQNGQTCPCASFSVGVGNN